MGDILHHLGALDDMKTSCKFIMEPFQVQEGNGNFYPNESKRLFWRWWNTLALVKILISG